MHLHEAFSTKVSLFYYLQYVWKLRQKILKKKEELIEILIKIYNYFKNMVEGNISQKFRLRNIDKTRNYVVEEIEQKL